MKKITYILILIAFTLYASHAFSLTAAQRAEQRRQQRAAQRAYQASANTYDEVSRTASTYKEGAEIVRDTVKQATPSEYRESAWGWSNED